MPILALQVCLRVGLLIRTPLPSTFFSPSLKGLKICIVWTSLKMFCSGYMAPFAYHDDRRLGTFSTTFSLTVLGSRLGNFLRTHAH